jgi:hypothetical protein
MALGHDGDRASTRLAPFVLARKAVTVWICFRDETTSEDNVPLIEGALQVLIECRHTPQDPRDLLGVAPWTPAAWLPKAVHAICLPLSDDAFRPG